MDIPIFLLKRIIAADGAERPVLPSSSRNCLCGYLTDLLVDGDLLRKHLVAIEQLHKDAGRVLRHKELLPDEVIDRILYVEDMQLSALSDEELGSLLINPVALLILAEEVIHAEEIPANLLAAFQRYGTSLLRKDVIVEDVEDVEEPAAKIATSKIQPSEEPPT